MDDLISRQAAIELFERELSARYNKRELAIGFIGAKNILENVPTVQPERPRLERKTGRWMYEPGMYMCSECWDAWAEEQAEEVMSFNYCPNCGADMRGEEHEQKH